MNATNKIKQVSFSVDPAILDLWKRAARTIPLPLAQFIRMEITRRSNEILKNGGERDENI